MNIRSALFIPGDNEKKLAKADEFAADALILDLEDSVAPTRKPVAREMVREFLEARGGRRKSQLWIRINPLDHPDVLQDLLNTIGGRPDCIMQPKTTGPDDVLKLSHYLDVLEAREGIAPGSIKVHSIATETAVAMFTLGAYAEAKLPRLVSMNWGAEDLSSAIGAAGNKGEDGDWDFPYQIVRTQFLFAAHAARVQAIDTLYADYKDEAGLRRSCDLARRQGFTGRIAIHPAQVDAINESFSPSEADVTHARLVVEAFAAEPDAGTIGIDGKMYDIPHLNQAKHVLAMHEAYANG
jgi:citrate lyase subunit beta/citryl-CoA lyase